MYVMEIHGPLPLFAVIWLCAEQIDTGIADEEAFTWTEDEWTLQDIYNYHQLPVVAVVSGGYYGLHSWETISSGVVSITVKPMI